MAKALPEETCVVNKPISSRVHNILYILHSVYKTLKKEVRNMYKIFNAILTIVWVLDILNVPCMEVLDTTIPINTLGWFLIWLFIPSAETTTHNKEN